MINKAMILYMKGKVKEADKLLLGFSGTSISEDQINIPKPKYIDEKGEKCSHFIETISCFITRLAYMLGSTDNITCVICAPNRI